MGACMAGDDRMVHEVRAAETGNRKSNFGSKPAFELVELRRYTDPPVAVCARPTAHSFALTRHPRLDSADVSHTMVNDAVLAAPGLL
jgi:hypothetical protein